jgi:hypothetical protein
MKLNLNNVSDYMVNSLPWALLSLNVKLWPHNLESFWRSKKMI